MSTGNKTSSSNGAFKRTVPSVCCAPRPKTHARRGKNLVWLRLPQETLHHILEVLVKNRAGLSIILLSMTSRELKSHVLGDLEIWRGLYMHWRGPMRPSRTYNSRRGMVTLLPTYPTSLPNFRPKAPPIT